MSIKRLFDAVERRGDIGGRVDALVLPISNRPRVTSSCAGKIGLREPGEHTSGPNLASRDNVAHCQTLYTILETPPPVMQDGIVVSFNRLGRNATGVSLFTDVLSAKPLELVRELVPNAAVIARLVDPNSKESVIEPNEVLSDSELLSRRPKPLPNRLTAVELPTLRCNATRGRPVFAML